MQMAVRMTIGLNRAETRKALSMAVQVCTECLRFWGRLHFSVCLREDVYLWVQSHVFV